MINYIKNPPIFHARWFTGGRENATEVTGFLADLNLHASWYQRFESEDEVRPEYIQIELDNEDDHIVTAGHWIVVSEDKKIAVHTAEVFHELYSIQPVPIQS